MKNKIEYKIHNQIINRIADIQFEYLYQDDFSNEHYIFKGVGDKKNGSKKINFDVYKNGEHFMNESVLNSEFGTLFENFLSKTEDYDFNIEFKKSALDATKSNLNEFVKGFEKALIAENFSLKGETNRMVNLSNYLRD